MVRLEQNVVHWKCNACDLTGTSRINNWNSPRARTCCGGAFARNRNRLLVVWTDMNSRCKDSRHPAYNRYKKFGAPDWPTKEHFISWALETGWQPGLEIDRVDNTKGYFPENCRFVSRKQNANNRSSSRYLTAFGETKTLVEWESDARCSVQAQTIAARLDRYGWNSIEDSISLPSQR